MLTDASCDPGMYRGIKWKALFYITFVIATLPASAGFHALHHPKPLTTSAWLWWVFASAGFLASVAGFCFVRWLLSDYLVTEKSSTGRFITRSLSGIFLLVFGAMGIFGSYWRFVLHDPVMMDTTMWQSLVVAILPAAVFVATFFRHWPRKIPVS